MSSKHLRGDINFAWPSAEIAVMGPDAAVNVIYRDEIKKAEDPQETRAALRKEYDERFANPYIAASLGTLTTLSTPQKRDLGLLGPFPCSRIRGKVYLLKSMEAYHSNKWL